MTMKLNRYFKSNFIKKAFREPFVPAPYLRQVKLQEDDYGAAMTEVRYRGMYDEVRTFAQ